MLYTTLECSQALQLRSLRSGEKGLDVDHPKARAQNHDELITGNNPSPSLAVLLMQMVHPLPASNWSMFDIECFPHRPSLYKRHITADTVTKLCQQGHLSEAVEAVGVLVQTNLYVSNSVFYTVLKECAAKKNLPLGRRVHAFTVKKGCESNTFVCNHILRLYSAHGRLQEAMDSFALVANPDRFTWSVIISAHVKQGNDKQAIELYQRSCRSKMRPDERVFVAVLQACAKGRDLKSGQQVHADVLAAGIEPGLFVYSSLVDMYAKCGRLEEAQRIFDGLPRKDLVTWSALIAGYCQQGLGQEALRLHSAMQEEGTLVLDGVTFVCLLQACANVGTSALEKGRQFHAQITERGFQSDLFVASSLVNMYVKCGSLEDARGVFDGLSQKNVVTWSAMIAGYSQQGLVEESFGLYRAMREEGTSPNSVTFVCLLQACASLGTLALVKGKELHAEIRRRCLHTDGFVGNSLVNMYAKCGSLENAEVVFEELPVKDVVTWNAMIAAYSQQGAVQAAFRLYKAMQEEGMAEPDSVTFVCLLQACANVAALHVGRQLHAQSREQGLQADVLVSGSLINMYSKCGSMVDAQQVFEELPEPDIFAWSSLIAGYTQQGDTEVVLELFDRMRDYGLQPAGITFLSVLTACSHTGLVRKGREYFEIMRGRYGISPTVEHYTCMVDLLGRAGLLDEALELIETMAVQPDAAVWHTLLGACRKWGSVAVGVHAFEEAVKLDQDDPAAYTLMSNIYRGAQMWEKAHEIQARRLRIGAWKQPGRTWWTDLDGVVHTFSVGDKFPGIEARCIQALHPSLYLTMEGKVCHVGCLR